MSGIISVRFLKLRHQNCLRSIVAPCSAMAAILLVLTLSMSDCRAQSEPTPSVTSETLASEVPQNPGRITIVCAGFTLDRITAKLNEQGIKVRARGNAASQLIPSFIARNEEAESAMARLINAGNDLIAYKPKDQPETTEIWTREEYNRTVLPKLVVQKIYKLKNAPPNQVEKQISGLLTSNLGSAMADERTAKIFVWDLPESHRKIEKVIQELDVEMVTRIFFINHADPLSLEGVLKRISKGDQGYPVVDRRTRQIIVRDRLEVIRRIELLVDALDIPTPANDKKQHAAQATDPKDDTKSRTGETARLPPQVPRSFPAPDPSRSEKSLSGSEPSATTSQSFIVLQPGGQSAVHPAEAAAQTSAAF